MEASQRSVYAFSISLEFVLLTLLDNYSKKRRDIKTFKHLKHVEPKLQPGKGGGVCYMYTRPPPGGAQHVIALILWFCDISICRFLVLFFFFEMSMFW